MGQTYTQLHEREQILEEIAEQMAVNSDRDLNPIELLECARDLLEIAHDLVKEAAAEASFESGPGGKDVDAKGLIAELEIRINSEHGYMTRETSVQDMIDTAHSEDEDEDEDGDDEDDEEEDEEDEEGE
jgi:hypothetical protein